MKAVARSFTEQGVRISPEARFEWQNVSLEGHPSRFALQFMASKDTDEQPAIITGSKNIREMLGKQVWAEWVQYYGDEIADRIREGESDAEFYEGFYEDIEEAEAFLNNQNQNQNTAEPPLI